jgi:hypothetical protein
MRFSIKARPTLPSRSVAPIKATESGAKKGCKGKSGLAIERLAKVVACMIRFPGQNTATSGDMITQIFVYLMIELL